MVRVRVEEVVHEDAALEFLREGAALEQVAHVGCASELLYGDGRNRGVVRDGEQLPESDHNKTCRVLQVNLVKNIEPKIDTEATQCTRDGPNTWTEWSPLGAEINRNISFQKANR